VSAVWFWFGGKGFEGHRADYYSWNDKELAEFQE
jgi:hypothetical protein